MMKCRCYLNQCLQERLLWLFSNQPNTFPVLVSEEKLLILVAPQTFRKRAVIPFKGHRLLIILPSPELPRV